MAKIQDQTERSWPDCIPLHQALDLTARGNVAHIDLSGQVYTLRITRAGKLILTK
ncbi:MAG: hemin uptake protein HemP [Rhodobacteraceae bacterium]|nr:MAG: hemin uptake protein HemP [Paracoccaceae bacterium]